MFLQTAPTITSLFYLYKITGAVLKCAARRSFSIHSNACIRIRLLRGPVWAWPMSRESSKDMGGEFGVKASRIRELLFISRLADPASKLWRHKKTSSWEEPIRKRPETRAGDYPRLYLPPRNVMSLPLSRYYTLVYFKLCEPSQRGIESPLPNRSTSTTNISPSHRGMRGSADLINTCGLSPPASESCAEFSPSFNHAHVGQFPFSAGLHPIFGSRNNF
jgi:hypothetical protein